MMSVASPSRYHWQADSGSATKAGIVSLRLSARLAAALRLSLRALNPSCHTLAATRCSVRASELHSHLSVTSRAPPSCPEGWRA